MDITFNSSAKANGRVNHSELYKNEGISNDFLYQKHRQETVQLRKKKRSDLFVKTRERNNAKRDFLEELATIENPSVTSILESDLIGNLTSGDRNRQTSALKIYRRLLQNKEDVEAIYHLNLHSTFGVIFLQSEPFTEIEELSIAVLSQMMIDTARLSELLTTSVITKIINSLSGQKANVVIESLCILETALSLDLAIKPYIFNFNLVSTLCDTYLRFDGIQLKRQIATVINVFFCEINVQIGELLEGQSFVDFLKHVLRTEADEVLLAETLETLTNIAMRSILHTDYIVTRKFLPIVIDFMDGSVIRSCLEFTSAIVEYGINYVGVLCSDQYFTRLWNVATSSAYPIRVRGEAFLLVSKFVKNGLLTIQPKVTTELVETLTRSLSSSMPFDIRVSSVSAIKELLTNDNSGIVKMCLSDDLLKSLCDLLTITKVESVIDVIVCLEKIMFYAVSHGMGKQIRSKLEEFNVTNKFVYLLQNQSLEIFTVADRFATHYLDESMDDE
ncbi:hypothetical protein M3Y98_00149000 [Aphelenchoides besseyi]|nr:hypothetical protein M3Y98_00149000 [Aphelenchoides besseyi]